MEHVEPLCLECGADNRERLAVCRVREADDVSVPEIPPKDAVGAAGILHDKWEITQRLGGSIQVVGHDCPGRPAPPPTDDRAYAPGRKVGASASERVDQAGIGGTRHGVGRIHEGQKPAARYPRPRVARCGQSELRACKNPKPRILGCRPMGNRSGAVGRAVVDHDHLDVLQSLRSQAVQTFTQVGRGIARDDDHGQYRCLVIGGPLPSPPHELPQPRLDRGWEPTREAAGKVADWSFLVVHRTLRWTGLRADSRRSLRRTRLANDGFFAGTPAGFGWIRSLGCFTRPTSRHSPEARRVKYAAIVGGPFSTGSRRTRPGRRSGVSLARRRMATPKTPKWM